jgi:hypothetical protein
LEETMKRRLVDEVRAVASDPYRSPQEILDELSEAQSEIEAWIYAIEKDQEDSE